MSEHIPMTAEELRRIEPCAGSVPALLADVKHWRMRWAIEHQHTEDHDGPNGCDPCVEAHAILAEDQGRGKP